MNNHPESSSNHEEPELIICKNCDHQFSGKYCSNCGQSVKELERPIRFMIADFMGTIITFDTRLVKTFITILFKPGKLTIDFLAGKRARYMPPFRFYLFVSFVMFLMISTITNLSFNDNIDDAKKTGQEIKADTNALIDSIQHSKDTVFVATREAITQELEEAEMDSIEIDDLDNIIGSIENTVESANDEDSKYYKTIKKIQDYPELYINKLYQYTSWSLFLFMPIFAFLLWISFYKTRKLFIGHLIFSLNIHSFIFTILIIIMGVESIFKNFSTGWIAYSLFLIPVYQIIGARRLYQRKWSTTFFKLTLVSFMYSIVWLIGLISLAIITFFGI